MKNTCTKRAISKQRKEKIHIFIDTNEFCTSMLLV